MQYSHIPVMLNEVIECLNPQPGQNFVDCTIGGGGHSAEILKRVAPNGKVLGIDLDAEAIKKVKSLEKKLILVQDNFANLDKILKEEKIGHVHGILLDLGISSAEYESGKGFSFQKDELLDMRFGTVNGYNLTAEDIVNKWSKDKLIKIFKEYGEERLAGKIANRIIEERYKDRIETSKKLGDLIFSEYKKAYKNKTFKKHPATKVFQSLRIAVNHELENLESVLPQALLSLEKGGRIAIISFHSLEDRIVKKFFVKESNGCVCPPEFPICKCGYKPALKIITKKPLLPSDEEVNKNPRSRSAKLRVAERI
ncbi:MAG: 16S rRNA (cytosine(1402)-N(4))-methyltransferase RsmH [bacterium]